MAYLLISSDEGDDYDKHSKTEALLTSWLAGGLLKLDDQGRYTPEAVLVLQTRLEQGGLWSEGVQRWCGVWGQQAAPAVEADRQLSSTALKAELIGAGSILDKAGNPLQWRNVLENSKLVLAAKVPNTEAGGESFWRVEAFKKTLTFPLCYSIDYRSVVAAPDGMYGQLSKQKRMK